MAPTMPAVFFRSFLVRRRLHLLQGVGHDEHRLARRTGRRSGAGAGDPQLRLAGQRRRVQVRCRIVLRPGRRRHLQRERRSIAREVRKLSSTSNRTSARPARRRRSCRRAQPVRAHQLPVDQGAVGRTHVDQDVLPALESNLAWCVDTRTSSWASNCTSQSSPRPMRITAFATSTPCLQAAAEVGEANQDPLFCVIPWSRALPGSTRRSSRATFTFPSDSSSAADTCSQEGPGTHSTLMDTSPLGRMVISIFCLSAIAIDLGLPLRDGEPDGAVRFDLLLVEREAFASPPRPSPCAWRSTGRCAAAPWRPLVGLFLDAHQSATSL